MQRGVRAVVTALAVGTLLLGLLPGTAAAQTVGLDDVLDGDVDGVSVQLNGNGSYFGSSINASFDNQTGQTYTVENPVGLRLKPSDPAAQVMLTAGGPSVTVPPGQSTGSFVAFCGERYQDTPGSHVEFEADGYVSGGTMRALENIDDEGLHDSLSASNAVWFHTDGIDIAGDTLAEEIAGSRNVDPGKTATGGIIATLLAGGAALLGNALGGAASAAGAGLAGGGSSAAAGVTSVGAPPGDYSELGELGRQGDGPGGATEVQAGVGGIPDDGSPPWGEMPGATPTSAQPAAPQQPAAPPFEPEVPDYNLGGEQTGDFTDWDDFDDYSRADGPGTAELQRDLDDHVGVDPTLYDQDGNPIERPDAPTDAEPDDGEGGYGEDDGEGGYGEGEGAEGSGAGDVDLDRALYEDKPTPPDSDQTGTDSTQVGDGDDAEATAADKPGEKPGELEPKVEVEGKPPRHTGISYDPQTGGIKVGDGNVVLTKDKENGWGVHIGDQMPDPSKNPIPNLSAQDGKIELGHEDGMFGASVTDRSGDNVTFMRDPENDLTAVQVGDANDRTTLSNIRDRYDLSREFGPGEKPTGGYSAGYDTESGDFDASYSDQRSRVSVSSEGGVVKGEWGSNRGNQEFLRSLTLDTDTGEGTLTFGGVEASNENDMYRLSVGPRTLAVEEGGDGFVFTMPHHGDYPVTVGAGDDGRFVLMGRTPGKLFGNDVEYDVMLNNGMRVVPGDDMLPDFTPDFGEDQFFVGVKDPKTGIFIRGGQQGDDTRVWLGVSRKR